MMTSGICISNCDIFLCVVYYLSLRMLNWNFFVTNHRMVVTVYKPVFGFADISVRHGCGYGRHSQYISSTHTANVPVSYTCNTASLPVSCRRGYNQCQCCVNYRAPTRSTYQCVMDA